MCLYSTILSAKRRSDHLANPAGGSAQQSATKFASTSPSTFFVLVAAVARLSRTPSKPSSINFFFPGQLSVHWLLISCKFQRLKYRYRPKIHLYHNSVKCKPCGKFESCGFPYWLLRKALLFRFALILLYTVSSGFIWYKNTLNIRHLIINLTVVVCYTKWIWYRCRSLFSSQQ